MCTLPSALSAVMGIGSLASGGFSYFAEKQQAKAQDYMHDLNRRNALTALNEGYATSQYRQAQETDAAARDIEKRRQEAEREAATARAAAGEAGVGGISVGRVMRDIAGMAARDESDTRQSRDWSVAQLNADMKGLHTQTISRIASVPRGRKPSLFGHALATLPGLGQAYQIYKEDERQPRR